MAPTLDTTQVLTQQLGQAHGRVSELERRIEALREDSDRRIEGLRAECSDLRERNATLKAESQRAEDRYRALEMQRESHAQLARLEAQMAHGNKPLDPAMAMLLDQAREDRRSASRERAKTPAELAMEQAMAQMVQERLVGPANQAVDPYAWDDDDDDNPLAWAKELIPEVLDRILSGDKKTAADAKPQDPPPQSPQSATPARINGPAPYASREFGEALIENLNAIMGG
ncbi:MAG: hypothetical protein Q8R92_03515 [Deltaproteobacteria bacterium]|nr:hypothetical protein [Deltaproteobacteria bacterium]